MSGFPGFRQILFATDFSAASDHACRTAIEFARHFRAQLHVVHIVPPATDPIPSKASLAEVMAAMPSDLAVTSETLNGLPARQIVAYARRAGIDLIVLGTHGRTGVSHAIVGSVAEAVVRRARCRVLVVPARLEEPEPGTVVTESGDVQTVCVVCERPTPDMICEDCRGRIRARSTGQ